MKLICGLEIVLYIVSFFNFIYVFYMFVVLETFVLLHFNAFSQAQTVLSDGEEKEETGCYCITFIQGCCETAAACQCLTSPNDKSLVPSQEDL